jgi:hypothetical protein
MNLILINLSVSLTILTSFWRVYGLYRKNKERYDGKQ